MVNSLNLKIKHNKNKFHITINSVDKGTQIDSHNDIMENYVGDNWKGDLTNMAEQYNEVYSTYYNWLVSRRQLSTYDINILNFEKLTMMTPLTCSIGYTNRALIGIDVNKAYTSNLMDMYQFPVFNSFDRYHEYDQHQIEDYTMYYIKSTNNNTSSAILFGSLYSRAYGYKLNRIDKSLFQILAHKRPSNLVKSNAMELIKKLYDNDQIPSDTKKSIINVLLGLLEKKMNKNIDCKLFVNKSEAQYYIEESGGKIGELSYYEDLPEQ